METIETHDSDLKNAKMTICHLMLVITCLISFLYTPITIS